MSVPLPDAADNQPPTAVDRQAVIPVRPRVVPLVAVNPPTPQAAPAAPVGGLRRPFPAPHMPLPAPPPPVIARTGWFKCRYVFDCHFADNAEHARDIDCLFITAVVVLFLTGVVCGVVVMPIYLARATEQVYKDSCVVTGCSSYTASVYAKGFVISRSITMSAPCDPLVNAQRDCYVKVDVKFNRHTVTFTRPGLATALVTGVVGWAILLAMLAWLVMLCYRHRTTQIAQRRAVIGDIIAWTVIVPVIAYAVIVGLIAFPWVFSSAKSDLRRDLCHVHDCTAADIALMHVKSGDFLTTVHLGGCEAKRNATLPCLRHQYSGAVVMRLPKEATIIGLGVTGWTVLSAIIAAALVGFAAAVYRTCARLDEVSVHAALGAEYGLE